MFSKHNVYSRLSYWLIFIAGIGSFAYALLIFLAGNADGPTAPLAIPLLLIAASVLNFYLAYMIFKKSKIHLLVATAIYALQAVSFESSEWAMGIQLGMNLSAGLNIGETRLDFNILAVVLVILLVASILKIRREQRL